jgi:hypothetical protein
MLGLPPPPSSPPNLIFMVTSPIWTFYSCFAKRKVRLHAQRQVFECKALGYVHNPSSLLSRTGIIKLGMVTHGYNPSTQEEETAGS